MNTIDDHIEIYLEYCKYRKRLDSKTLKAYRIDLKQYATYSNTSNDHFSKSSLDSYLTILHKQYKPKTVKRKIASLKAFSTISPTGKSYLKIHSTNWISGSAKPSSFPKQSPSTPCKPF